MLKILYTDFRTPISDEKFSNYLSTLPADIQKKNNRYLRADNKHSHLLGKLLLRDGLKLIGYDNLDLKDVKYTTDNRPHFNSEIDFSISHSDKFVICAISQNHRVGVDIEKIRPMNLNHYKSEMTPDQWNDIHNSPNPELKFLEYWTIKESVAKANGNVAEYVMAMINLEGAKAIFENKTWYTQSLNIDNEYFAYLSSDRKIDNISYHRIDF